MVDTYVFIVTTNHPCRFRPLSRKTDRPKLPWSATRAIERSAKPVCLFFFERVRKHKVQHLQTIRVSIIPTAFHLRDLFSVLLRAHVEQSLRRWKSRERLSPLWYAGSGSKTLLSRFHYMPRPKLLIYSLVALEEGSCMIPVGPRMLGVGT